LVFNLQLSQDAQSNKHQTEKKLFQFAGLAS